MDLRKIILSASLFLCFFAIVAAGEVYQIFLFDGDFSHFHIRNLQNTAQLNPSHFYSSYYRIKPFTDMAKVFDLPVHVKIENVEDHLEKTYNGIVAVQKNMKIQGRNADFYKDQRKKLQRLYEHMGYNPKPKLSFQKGLLTTFLYYSHMQSENVSEYKYRSIFNFDYPDVKQQLIYGYAIEKVTKQLIPSLGIEQRILQLDFEDMTEADNPFKETPLFDKLLEFKSISFSLKLSGTELQLREQLNMLIRNFDSVAFSFDQRSLSFRGRLHYCIFFRSKK